MDAVKVRISVISDNIKSVACIQKLKLDIFQTPLAKHARGNFGSKAQKAGTHQQKRESSIAVLMPLLKHNIGKVYILQSVWKEVVVGAEDAIAKELSQEAAHKTKWIRCDLPDWWKVKHVAEEIKKNSDGLDILINNAARRIMTYQLTDYGVDRQHDH
ncbi:hypothetical protein F5B19DRAFT_495291 [Rostrohypoxylon terebratum]|nr:hypothetical protein F5B19DRAFT_495291 [Rostrohypoxylon terebratum]